MKKRKRLLIVLPLISLALILPSCQPQQPSSTPDSSSTSSSISSSSSDSSSESSQTSESSETSQSSEESSSVPDSSVAEPWTPGENAVEADQPEVSNPSAVNWEMNKLRETQGEKGMPSIGESNILVVPVQLSDLVNTDYALNSNFVTYTESAFSGASTTIASVEKFYETSSYGVYTPHFVMAPAYTLSLSTTSASALVSTSGYLGYLNAVLAEVYNYFFVDETRCYNPADFDSDDDGKVDGIFLIHSLPSSNLMGSTGDTYFDQTLADATILGDSISSVPVNAMSWNSIYDTFLTYLLRLTSNLVADSHMYITSLGYMLGIEDYFDLTGSGTNNTYRAPLGLVDRMDGYIGDHNSFSKYFLGWSAPTFITADDVDADGLTVTIKEGEPLAISAGDEGYYGEYLLLDYYDADFIDSFDSTVGYVNGRTTFSQDGLRLYEVNSSLVQENNGIFVDSDGNDLDNGKAHYFAHSNSSVNPLADYGIIDTEPLISFLSKDASNRHIVDYNVPVDDNDLFYEGDSSTTEIPGYYDNFALDSGARTGLSFTVDSLANGEASVTIRRVQQ